MDLLLKRLVLTAALLIMPLQGVAATVSVLLCNGDAQSLSGDVRAGLDQDKYHGNTQQNDGGTSAESAYHPCFHFAAYAPPVETLMGALPDFPPRSFAPDSSHDLFVPDRPQRPPLA